MNSEHAIESMRKKLSLFHVLYELKVVSRESFISFCETYNRATENLMVNNLGVGRI